MMIRKGKRNVAIRFAMMQDKNNDRNILVDGY